MTKDNNLLGKFKLDDIPPMPRGVPQIEVTFHVDANGILNVSAVEKSTGKTEKITVTNDKGSADIDRLVQEAKRYKSEAKNALENYASKIGNLVTDEKVADKISKEKKEEVLDAVKQIISWVNCNHYAQKEKFEEKLSELEKVVLPILCVEAKNALENYASKISNSVQEVLDAVSRTALWLDSNQDEAKEKFQEKQKELEEIVLKNCIELIRAGSDRK